MSEKAIVLNSRQLIKKIIRALEDKKPLSIVSVGATESYVMAQYTILSEKEIMNHPEAKVANKGYKKGARHRGIRFPNIEARDMAIEAVKKTNIVGYCTSVMNMEAGLMTEKVFDAYEIRPKYIFDAYLRRVIMFSQEKKFHQMLRGRKILLVSTMAEKAENALNKNLKKKLGFKIVGTIKIDQFEEISRVKREIDAYEFDLCLLAAGINAVILAVYVSEVHGKVAFDIGQGMESLITGQMVIDDWMEKIIGMDNLLNM